MTKSVRAARHFEMDFSCKRAIPENTYNDQVWVDVSLGKNVTLLCGCVYRSPTKDKQSTEDICKILHEMCTQNKPILICGDFNYPEIEWYKEYRKTSNLVRPLISSDDPFLKK